MGGGGAFAFYRRDFPRKVIKKGFLGEKKKPRHRRTQKKRGGGGTLSFSRRTVLREVIKQWIIGDKHISKYKLNISFTAAAQWQVSWKSVEWLGDGWITRVCFIYLEMSVARRPSRVTEV